MTVYLNALGKTLALSGKTTSSFVGSTTSGTSLTGTDGADAFRGYFFTSSYAGGKGDDIYNISRSTDLVIEKAGEGIDTVRAESKYKLGDHIENLELVSTNAWYGEGNALDNILTATKDKQTLNGGAGNDVLVSQATNTTFVVQKGNGSDVIYGWDSTDKIRLDQYNVTSFSTIQSLAKQVGADTVLNFANGETLTLRATAATSLQANNFMLAQDTTALKTTFVDNFDTLSLYSKGGTWRTEYGYGGAGTLASRSLPNEAQIYMDADYAGTGKTALGINPFSLDKGILTITAAPTADEAKPYLGNAAYTSGLLSSKFTFAQEYGVFEVKAKLPGGAGMWPSFWLLPTDNSWPPELDVFEGLGTNPDNIYLTTHDLKDGKHVLTQSIVNLDTTQWHTYGVNWGPDKITYLIDGQAVATHATPESMKGKEMFMMLNMAVSADGWAGKVDANTGTRQMEIDYVRAYQTADTVVSTTNGVKTWYAPAATTPVVTTPTTTTPVTTTPVTSPPAAPAVSVAKLMGTTAMDWLTAAAHNTEMYGQGGDDILRAGSFSAKMYGGDGNDTYYVNTTSQVVTEAANQGGDKVVSTISYTLGDNLETLVLDGAANINGTGNNLGNKLIGNTGDNILTGGTGADWLDGGTGGRDTLIGGAGDDTYIVGRAGTILIEKAGEGYDAVRSTVSWTLGSNFEALVLDGSASIDATGNALDNRLIGNAGNNVITGGAGNDWLDGGSGGLDVLSGGTGNDTYVVNRTNIKLVEKAGEGLDSVQSTVTWTLGDNFENLSLNGSANINGTGNALDNRISGNTANNVITGGAGNDTLIGGGGTDTFVFGRGFGKDVVTDYNTNDVLQFSGFSKAAMKIVQSGANTVIDFGGADTITLWNTQASDVLAHGHFMF